MPYIFVRGTLESSGLFSNETFIDFQNVEDGNGEFVGAILSRQLGAYVVTGHASGYPQAPQNTHFPFEQQKYYATPPGTIQTLGVARQPPVVLNTLAIHAGYKVVAANQQLPKPLIPLDPRTATGVSYTVWTLHKPLP